MDHDVSILIPELWCRMDKSEKNPEKMIREGMLEKLEDFEYKGQKVLASRLGNRITRAFVFKHFGRVFEEPIAVFSDEMLKPELQNMEDYVDGINNIVEAQQKSALMYFEDGSVEAAIPPLQVLLHIMAYGHYNNKNLSNPELRDMFTREYVISSSWYKERLLAKKDCDINGWNEKIDYIQKFKKQEVNKSILRETNLDKKLKQAKEELEKVKSKQYLDSLVGTIGLDIRFK